MTVVKEYTDFFSEGYLTDRVNADRLEYNQKEICEIAENSRIHDTICVNAIGLLKNHIRSMGYHIHTGNVKVSIDEQANISYFPDITVSGNRWDKDGEYLKHEPHLIFEVTSSTTEPSDRGEKFADYRKLSTLQEYVLISQERVSVECFRRDRKGNWIYHPYTQGEEVYFASINFRTPIAALYEDVPVSRHSKYSMEKKKQERKRIHPPANTVIFPILREMETSVPPSLPTQKLPGNSSLKPNVLVGCLIALIFGFGINQLYDFWQHSSSKNFPVTPIDRSHIIAVPPVASQNNIEGEFQDTKPEELEARKMIALIERMQKGFYSENERFASNWDDLGFNVRSHQQNYEYKIVSSDERKTIITANAKKPGLKSYTGIVVVEGESAIDKICETNKPINTASEVVEIGHKTIQCPAGSTSVLGM